MPQTLGAVNVFSRMRFDRSAASAVEFALLLPVLVILLFGIMYGASVFNTQQTVTQAAREAARFGATLPLSAAGLSDEFPPSGAWYGLVEERALGVLANDAPLTLGDATPDICVAFSDGNLVDTNGNCPADPIPGLAAESPPRVRVIVSRPARIELGVASVGPFTLSASGLGRFEPEIADPVG